MRFVSRACSAETCAACCCSSQKPGRPSSSSSSATRDLTRSGSKVTTDPVELGPDLLQLIVEGKVGLVCHRGSDRTCDLVLTRSLPLARANGGVLAIARTPLRAVALLELLAAAAPARIVAAELLV